MIGPGWLPGVRPRAAPPGLRGRTRAYMRTRRRSRQRSNLQATTVPAANTDLVLFDHGPAELPVASVVAREPRARVTALVADLQRWIAARWQWLRPRTVPCAVAGLGMVAIVASADYLAHHHVEHIASAHVVHVDLAPR